MLSYMAYVKLIESEESKEPKEPEARSYAIQYIGCVHLDEPSSLEAFKRITDIDAGGCHSVLEFDDDSLTINDTTYSMGQVHSLTLEKADKNFSGRACIIIDNKKQHYAAHVFSCHLHIELLKQVKNLFKRKLKEIKK